MSTQPHVNPFRVGTEIRDPADFVGRTEILQAISAAMRNLQNVSLHGERRTGKTSLLLYLAHPASASVIGLPSTHIPVYFNFQGLAAKASAASIWQAIADAISIQIKQRHPDGQAEAERFLATIAAETSAMPATSFGRALAHLGSSDHKIHLLFDEFEQTAENPDLRDIFYDELRSLPQRAGNTSYVIATRTGLATLQPKYNKVSSPFFNIFTTMILHPFEEDQVYHLIFKYLNRSGLGFVAERLCTQSHFLHEVTGYHPFFLQTLCYHLCERIDEPGWPLGKPQQEALAAFENDADPHFRYYWEQSSPAERELLAKLATGQSVDWHETNAEPVRKELEARCLVVQTNELEPGWRLFSSVFGRWVGAQLLNEAKKQQQLEEWYRQGIAHLEREQWSEAIQCFEHIVNENPAYHDAVERLEYARPQKELEILYTQGLSYIQRSNWQQAITKLEAVVQRDSGFKDVAACLQVAQRQQEAEILYKQGKDRFNRGEWSQAIEQLERVLILVPGYRDVDAMLTQARQQERLQQLYRQGEEYLKKEEWQQAIDAFDQVVALDKDYMDTLAKLDEAHRQAELFDLYDRAQYYEEKKRWAEAGDLYIQILAKDRDYRDVARRLAEVQLQKELAALYLQAEDDLARGEWNKAAGKFYQVLKLSPGYRDAQAKLVEAEKKARLQTIYDMAMQDAKRENWKAAARKLKSILREEPAFPDVEAKLEWVERNERLAERYLLAIKRLKTKQWQAAIALLEQVLAEDPSYKDASEQLDEAKRHASRVEQPEPKSESQVGQVLGLILGFIAVALTMFAVWKINPGQLVLVIVGAGVSIIGILLTFLSSKKFGKVPGSVVFVLGLAISLIGMIPIPSSSKLEITSVNLVEGKVTGRMLVNEQLPQDVAVEVYMRTGGDRGWLLINPNPGSHDIHLDDTWTWTVYFGQEVHLEPGENLSFAALVPVGKISELPGSLAACRRGVSESRL